MDREGRSVAVRSSSDLERTIGSFRAIDDIVGAMKAYAGVAIRNTGELVRNVRTYEDHVLRAMADLSAHHADIRLEMPTRGRRIVAAFGSTQGLCGSYNERIAEAVAAFALPGDALFVIGRRLRSVFEARQTACAACSDSAASVSGIGSALQDTADLLKRAYAREEYESITLVFMTVPGKTPQVDVERILPPDRDRVRKVRPMLFPPLTYLDAPELFAKVLEEFLFITLYRGYLEALRSENWFRLRTLEGASENLKRRLAELGSLQRFARQEEITEEMLEIQGSGTFYQ
jgi:F-type H+-transporting ATPase subunit gamma